MVVGFLASMGLIVFLFTVRSVYTAYLFGALWGVSHGGIGVLVTILLARYYGRASFGTINGVMRPFEASGLALGQILGGVIYDLTGSYQGLFVGSFGLYLLSMVLILMAGQPVRPREAAGR
jgi:MFS family permease